MKQFPFSICNILFVIAEGSAINEAIVFQWQMKNDKWKIENASSLNHPSYLILPKCSQPPGSRFQVCEPSEI